MRSWRVVAGASLLCLAIPSSAQLGWQTLTSGLARPLAVVQPPGDNRLFVVEQRTGSTGRIRVYKNGAMLATPYLSITNVSTASEQGLLGLAFHPNFQNNYTFFVNYTDSGGTTVIAKYTAANATTDVANAASADVILRIPQPYNNHNGGTLHFGDDGHLYISSGDGGNANDPGNRAQNRNNLLGKILRIDVDGDDFPLDPDRDYRIPPDNPFVGGVGAGEVWSWGLRNPWKFDFDDRRLGGFGGMTIADVGQDAWEEVNYEPPGTAGRNYGWRVMEGLVETGLTGGIPPYTNPIHVYGRGSGCSITGGVIYRGSRLGIANYGRYFYTDYCNPRLMSFRINIDPLTGEATAADLIDHISLGSVNPTSLNADNNGELYYTTVGGSFRRITITTSNWAVEGQFNWTDLEPGAPVPDRAEVEYRPHGSTTPTHTLSIGLTQDGRFRLPAPSGNIDISVKASHFLRRTVNVNTTNSDALGVLLVMINGDIDGDNEISIGDYALLSSAFGSDPSMPNWNPNADLNKDGSVDIGDYAVLSSRFGQVGDD